MQQLMYRTPRETLIPFQVDCAAVPPHSLSTAEPAKDGAAPSWIEAQRGGSPGQVTPGRTA